MRDPMSRKLFQSRDAREKLRGMGGIMASSPELAQTVARFNNGGDITVPVVPSASAANRLSEAARILIANGMPASEVQALIDQGVDLNFMLAQLPPGAAPAIDAERPADIFPPSSAEAEVRRITGPGMTPAGTPLFEQTVELLPPGTTPPVTEELLADSSLRALLANQMEEEGRGRAVQEERAVARGRQTADAARRNEAEAQAADAELARVDAARRAAQELADAGDEEGGFDFDTSYEQMLSRLGRVLGDENGGEDRRQKAMANLAMIGLAIAAGQSPNALTNIAQGALAGTQAIRQSQAERERDERALRTAAFEAALRQEEAQRTREATAAQGELEFQRQLELEREKARLRPAGADGMLDIPPLARIYGDVQQAAIARFNDPTGGRPPDALEGDTATTYADRLATQASNLAQLRNPEIYGEATWLRSQIDQFLEQATESGEVSLEDAKTRLRGILMQQYPGVNLEAYGL